jgi:hypothetical protein
MSDKDSLRKGLRLTIYLGPNSIGRRLRFPARWRRFCGNDFLGLTSMLSKSELQTISIMGSMKTPGEL